MNYFFIDTKFFINLNFSLMKIEPSHHYNNFLISSKYLRD